MRLRKVTTPERPAPVAGGHPVRTRTRPAGFAVAALLATATAGCGVAVHPSAAATEPSSGTASAAPPVPMSVSTAKVPAAKATPKPAHSAPHTGSTAASAPTGGLDGHKGALLLDATGSTLTGWNQTSSYCPQTSGMVGDGTVGTDDGAAALTVSGQAGSCVGLISPSLYSSAVIEADIDFPALPKDTAEIANWCGFWLTNGDEWPQAGELDAVEVEPVDARNAVTWHSGTTSDEFSASTSGYGAVRLPVTGANLSPGWHTVDIVYTKGYFAVYYDGVQYTSYSSSNVTGDPLNVYLTMANTPNTAAITSMIGSPPINSSTAPATMSVRYVKVWSYRP